MSKEIQSSVDKWTKQLGLTWQVGVQFASVDRPQIVSSKGERSHAVALPHEYRGKVSEYEFDLAHELIHAEFAEKVDPIFSTIFFDPRIDTQNPNTRKSMMQVYYAQQFVDVWVGDRMKQIDKSLVERDITSFTTSFFALPDAELTNLEPLDLVVGAAINAGHIAREHSFKKYAGAQSALEQRVGRILGKRSYATMRQLGALHSQIPGLTMNAAKDIPVLESQTQKAAHILGFPVRPRIGVHQDQVVWLMQ